MLNAHRDDLMAGAGCLYHASWIVDDQPWPIKVRGGQKFIYVPYSGQTNDAGMLAWNREADYFAGLVRTSSTRSIARAPRTHA